MLVLVSHSLSDGFLLFSTDAKFELAGNMELSTYDTRPSPAMLSKWHMRAEFPVWPRLPEKMNRLVNVFGRQVLNFAKQRLQFLIVSKDV